MNYLECHAFAVIGRHVDRFLDWIGNALEPVVALLATFAIRWGEVASAVAIAAALFLMFVISCIGCASTECPPPSVINAPCTPVEVPVPATGAPLPVCVPSHRVCDQPDVVDRVRCLGENTAALKGCNDENVATLNAHNEGVTDAPTS